MPNAAETLQMTKNLYLMGGSSISSNKTLKIFTGTDPKYSEEDYLNEVTAILIFDTGPEPVNTAVHQTWITRRIDAQVEFKTRMMTQHKNYFQNNQ